MFKASVPSFFSALRRGGNIWRLQPASLASLSAVRFNSTGNNNAGKSASEEDKEELERERLLRERFAQKIQGDIPNQQANANPFFNANPERYPGAAPGIPNPEAAQKGMPWWELPVATAACFLLLRILYPRAEENRIKQEFEDACRQNPYLTFDQFINWKYPQLFQGYRNNQPQVIATVAACLSAAKDLKFARVMYRAAGKAKDKSASADDIVDAIRRDYSSLF